MTPTDNAIKQSADLIISECQNYNEKILHALNQQSPETTPSELKIRLGAVYYLSKEISYENYMRGAIYSYLEQRSQENIRAPNAQEICNQSIEIDWSTHSGVGGQSVPSQNYIWIAYLPENFQAKLASDLKNNAKSLQSPHPPQLFGEFLKALCNKGKLEKKSREDYISTIAHEITHLVIKQNTSIGRLYHENKTSDEDLALEIENLLGETQEISKSEQARRVGSNKYIKAIDESFAHYIGDLITGEVGPKKPRYYSSYDYPKGISWGYNILLEKFGENASIDHLRQLELEIFEEIAQRGQVQEGSGYRNPLVYFIKHILPENDKELLIETRRICENELRYTYRDVRKSVKDVENESNNKKLIREFQKFEKQVDWNNPSEIEDVILHRVLEKAVGNYGLNQVGKEIRNNLVKELQILQNNIEKLRQIEKPVQKPHADRELIESIKELEKVEQEIEKLLKKTQR